MSSKFIQQLQAEELREWLTTIDLTNADITQVEREIYTALLRARPGLFWSPTPIAPLAEPANLQHLLGDHFNGAATELGFQSRRLDNIYQWLSETNNTLTAQIELAERLTLETSNNLQDILVVTTQDPQFFYWVSDTFNNTAYVDQANTTAMTDTDHGLVLLSPVSMERIQDIKVELRDSETKGIPGSNLLIIDRGNAGGPEKEPDPVFERANSVDFSNVLDDDPNTWFEVERNFIPLRQKLTRFGRAYVFNSAGIEQDVRAVTGDLDWRAYVQWWNQGSPDSGPDGKGVLLAEFKDVQDSVNVRNQNSIQLGTTEDNLARLAFDLHLSTPKPLSFLNIVPFSREGQTIVIDSVKAFSQGQEIELARNVLASPNLSSASSVSREVLRRTGTQTTGGMLSIPSNRDIDRIEIKLSSSPIKAPYGLGHPFAEKLEHIRREQRVIFFSIVKHENVWTRIPYMETPRQISATYSQYNLLGSLPATLSQLLGQGLGLQNDLQRITQTGQNLGTSLAGLLQSVNAASTAGKLLNGTKIFGSVGKSITSGLGGVLGTAIPIVGGLLAAGDIIQNMFGYKKDISVKEVRQGVDVFEGYRAAVGLRSVSLMRINFNPLCQIQSVRRSFQGPVKKIGLFVEEQIPSHWGSGEWISYFISTDGESWTQVGKLTDVTIDNGLELPKPTETVYFRAVLRGNPEDPWSSPRLKHYALQGLPV